jgi:hypothetical protein
MKMDAEAVDGAGGADIVDAEPDAQAFGQRQREHSIDAGSDSGLVSVHDTSVRENGLFQYIDGAHRGEVVIGCRSSHMRSQRELVSAIGVSRNAAP